MDRSVCGWTEGEDSNCLYPLIPYVSRPYVQSSNIGCYQLVSHIETWYYVQSVDLLEDFCPVDKNF